MCNSETKIDGIFYINLDHREDRKQNIEKQLNNFNLKFERFCAIKISPPMGILGCGLSHLQVLKIAREKQYSNVLIFEDDFVFTITNESYEDGIKALFSEHSNFDVCMLSYNLQQYENIDKHFIKIIEAQTASAYIVNKHYYNTLIDLYEYAMPNLESTQQHWVYANDQIWKKLQKTDNWIGMNPRMGKQMDGYSDNSQQFCSYGV